MRKKVIILGDFMINNINSQELSKSKKNWSITSPWAISFDIVFKVNDALDHKPKSLIVWRKH